MPAPEEYAHCSRNHEPSTIQAGSAIGRKKKNVSRLMIRARGNSSK